jgi:hypothetical protein
MEVCGEPEQDDAAITRSSLSLSMHMHVYMEFLTITMIMVGAVTVIWNENIYTAPREKWVAGHGGLRRREVTLYRKSYINMNY